MNETINEDTYQTLKEVEVTPYEKATLPMWKPDTGKEDKISLFVATPVHSECSIHYTQALLELQQICFKEKIKITFQLLKSSLVTQGRNLCVSGFLESNYSHMLFVDSDIYFNAKSIIEMIKKNKDIISIPYPLKTIMWDKAMQRIKNNSIKNVEDLKKAFNTYPMKVENYQDITLDNGVIKVTHSPTGCMMIKRSVFNKLIEKYPDKGIVQKTVINGEYINKPHMWNFFDCIHDPETKTYLGEDFSFCKLWKDIGGECYAYVTDSIIHVGEHQYEGSFIDELKPAE
mgnify:CR=1 FL=1|tara:strand:- start:245 stop:1105 length:861 start_codon:yes stop_codon:yes gene_type:complete